MSAAVKGILGVAFVGKPGEGTAVTEGAALTVSFGTAAVRNLGLKQPSGSCKTSDFSGKPGQPAF